MLMGMYKHIKSTLISEYKERPQSYKDKITEWNALGPITRVERPSNLPRARSLGYKAKQGIIVVRVRLKGGRKKRAAPDGGRKPSKSGRFFTRDISMKSIAENRASVKFSNCEVINSYFVGSAGSVKYYEIIMVSKGSPAAKSPSYSLISSKNGRAARGLTSSGIKHRGLRA